MTILCIIFAVFLVTAVFSMADMGVKIESTRLIEKHNNLSFADIWSSTTTQTLFTTAAILFAFILIAGILMVSSSINTNVAQRTKFFGMMRCIGMSKSQIIHFVRLEALMWCKTAIPIGIIIGVIFTWILCIMLRCVGGEDFSAIPMFKISLIGIISGILLGVTTVLIAASSPAKRAAKVSPVTAVSGNSENTKNIRHTVINTHIFKIETILGIHHAISAKKNLVLMASSFAFSIILFLSFLVLVDFINYIMPQSFASPDISISSNDTTNTIKYSLLDSIGSINGVKHVFGRRSILDIPAKLEKENHSDYIGIISYSEFELTGLVKDKVLKKGSDISKLYDDSNYVLATWDKDSLLEIGDKIYVNNEKLEIVGLLKYDPFNSNGLTNGKITLITSDSAFTNLTGITDYSLIMVQTANTITEEEINEIANLIKEGYTFSDRRDQQTTGVYTVFVFCIYGFLSVITLVTILNIINSISMSVSAKIKQYGAMRAVGRSKRQITKMIVAKAFTYAVIGTIIGYVMGLFISKCLYTLLISSHFSYATWNIPFVPLLGVILLVVFSVIVASYTPSKRIQNTSITEVINEL